MKRFVVLLVAAAASPAAAFLATPRWSSVTGSPHVPVAARKVAATGQPAAAQPESNGPAVAGMAALVAALLLKGANRNCKVSMNADGVKSRMPAIPGMVKPTEVARRHEQNWKRWLSLRRMAKRGMQYDTKRYSQVQIMKKAGISKYLGEIKLWYPGQERYNMYYGPESHPDNPDFPAASSGYRALGGWAPAELSASAGRQGKSGSLFVAGRAPTLCSKKRMVAGSRLAVAMHAHKMAASCSKNHGSSQNASHWGIKRCGLQGNAVKKGQVLAKQRGTQWYPGANIVMGKDYKLIANADGIVQWRGRPGHKEVFVVPWQYVRERCTWKNLNTLTAKEYEPWMGNHTHGKRRDIIKLRHAWAETEEGKAHLQKKAEKKARQKEITKKIYAAKKKRTMEKLGLTGQRAASKETA